MSPKIEISEDRDGLNHLICPLCGGTQSSLYYKDRVREYYQCRTCKLVFVPKDYHLGLAEEKSEYDLHENAMDDPGYQKFLSRLSEPLLTRLGRGKKGLDFGCGPAPVLARMFEQCGHNMQLYDPYYFNDTSVLEGSYDFITASEVVEHLREPLKEFQLLFDLLLPGGWLGIMTKLVLGREAFSSWHYIRDLTHVSFYSRDVFDYIGVINEAEVEYIGKDVILLQKR